MATIAPSVPAPPAPAAASPSDCGDNYYHLITNHLSSTEITSLAHRLLQSDHEPQSTSQSSASPKRYAAVPTSTMEYNNQLHNDSSENPDLPAMARASVPRINSGLRLDASGAFVVASREEAHPQSRAYSGSASFKMEDDIMDRRRGMSFVEIGNREKMEVFQLPAVRRSMRHLNHASVLMNEELLTIATRYMEIGPSRASMMAIGHEALKEKCTERTYHDELYYTSPFWYYCSLIRGYSKIGFFLGILSGTTASGVRQTIAASP